MRAQKAAIVALKLSTFAAMSCVTCMFLCPLGVLGVGASFFCAVAYAAILFLNRDRKIAPSMAGTILGSLAGAFLGIAFVSPMVVSSLYIYDHGFGETAQTNLWVTPMGAALGGFLGSAMSRLDWRIKL